MDQWSVMVSCLARYEWRGWLMLVLLSLSACASNSPVPMSGMDNSRLILVNVDLTEPSQLSLGAGGKPYTGGQYSLPLQSAQTLADIARDYPLKRLESWPIAALGLHCGLLEVRPGQSVEIVLTRLQADTRVKLVQRVNQFETQGDQGGSRLPDDPYYGAQYDDQAELIARVHDRQQGSGITVAVIDTGADVSHPDLEHQISAQRNFVDDDEQRFLADQHGTAVAGIIAAEANNGIGIVGLAPGARLQILKACWQVNGNGAARCNSFTLAKALAFVLESSPDVLNMSLAGPEDPLLGQLIQRVIGNGTVVVAAASSNPERKGFPAALPGVVSVAQAAGAGVDDVVAPGSERLTTRPGQGFDFYSGNSMSTAYVSGLVALMRADQPARHVDALTLALHHPDSDCLAGALLRPASSGAGVCP